MLQDREKHFSIKYFRSLAQKEQKNKLLSLTDEEAAVLLYDWPFWARENQIPPKGDWTHWLILAGRGFGKTRTGAEYIRDNVEKNIAGRIALIAPTSADYRDTMIEGESGLLAISPPWFMPTWEPSKRRLTWPNGAIATCFSAEEPERLRGPQHDLAWCDELCAWKRQQESWDMMMFGLRLGNRPRVCITTTPKPTKLIKSLVSDLTVHMTKGSTYDNLDNLADTFREQIISKYEGTRLGRQELLAEILSDVPGALWNRDMLEESRISTMPELKRIVVAVDPPVTSGEKADECGIVVAGVDYKKHAYILADKSVKGLSPVGWAEEVVAAYNIFEADRVVAEVNNGGDLIENVIRQVDQNISYRKVHATKGKVIRAEPIAALYEQGRVHHMGIHSGLEDQMCEFTTDFDKKAMGYSPDRVDALVWALTELMLAPQPAAPLFGIYGSKR